jgi:hypothetical protein
MAKFNPSEAISCLPAGVYDATIDTVEDKQSKKGADMVVVSYTIYKPDGTTSTLKEYAVIPSGMWRVKRLCKACNASKAFESGDTGTIARELVGKNIKVTLSVAENGEFGDQNRIESYAPGAGIAAAAKSPAVPGIEESDIPF